ncbi:DUF1120 domain-containing protein [Serratia marcescens]
MKYNAISIVVMACVAMGSFSVNAAAPSAEIKIKGELDAPTCTVALGLNNSGTIDLGKISPALVKPSATTALGERNVVLNAKCSADTFLNFTIIDNRESSVSLPGTQRFGLGHINGNGKIGYYEIKMNQAYVDGSSTGLFSSASESFSSLSEIKLTKGMRNGWSTGSGRQAIGKDFTALLIVQPYLGSSKDMGGAINDKAALDGSATLSFAYGI